MKFNTEGESKTVHNLRSSVGEIHNWPLYPGKEGSKKKAGHSRFIGGRFQGQGNLLTRLVLGGHKTRQVDPHTSLPSS